MQSLPAVVCSEWTECGPDIKQGKQESYQQWVFIKKCWRNVWRGKCCSGKDLRILTSGWKTSLYELRLAGRENLDTSRNDMNLSVLFLKYMCHYLYELAMILWPWGILNNRGTLKARQKINIATTLSLAVVVVTWFVSHWCEAVPYPPKESCSIGRRALRTIFWIPSSH